MYSSRCFMILHHYFLAPSKYVIKIRYLLRLTIQIKFIVSHDILYNSNYINPDSAYKVIFGINCIAQPRKHTLKRSFSRYTYRQRLRGLRPSLK